MRTRSLAAVASRTLAGEPFDYCLADFLDGFYFDPQEAAILDVPALLAPSDAELGAVRDAYLAATAEELARQQGFRCPVWTGATERKLSRPWFASPHAALRAVLLIESPTGFRARILFVSSNALSGV